MCRRELELPTDRPRPPVSSYRGARYRFTVEPALHRGIADLARDEGASVFMVMQAGLSSLAHPDGRGHGPADGRAGGRAHRGSAR